MFDSGCVVLQGNDTNNIGPGDVKFKWSVGVESAVDSSFFWGYLITQVPGGFLASKFPANRIFGTAIATSSFLNLLLPGAISIHPSTTIIVRVCQGLVEVRLNANVIWVCFYLVISAISMLLTYLEGHISWAEVKRSSYEFA